MSLIISIFADYFDFRERLTNRHLVPDSNLRGEIYHWIEFAKMIIPSIAVVIAYPAHDVFAEFNKFPEQISKVSIMQL